MKIYKNCGNLPIHNFNEILKTSDLRFLIVGYDEFDENKELTVDEKIEFEDVWREIVYEYSALVKDNKIIANYKSRILIEENVFKHDMAVNILGLFAKHKDTEILTILSRFGWNINLEEDLEPQVSKVLNDINSLKTKISVLTLKHEERFKDSQSKDVVYVDRLDEEAISLELGLKLSYSLNTRTLSVLRWIKMWETCKTLNSKVNGKH